MRMRYLLLSMLFTGAAAAEPRSKPRPAAATRTPAPAAATPAPVEPAPAPPLVEAPPVVVEAKPEPRSTLVQPATGKPRLIVMGLTPAGGVDPAIAESLTETVAAVISAMKLFEVTSQKDLTTLLGVERQKQLSGCSETGSSCMAELADALGARFIVSGSVAKLGDAYQLNLQTQDSVKAQTLGRGTRIASDLTALREQLPAAIAEATATPPPTPPSKVLPVVLMSTGGAALVGAGVIFLQSFSRDQASISELNLAKTQPQLQLRPASYYRDEAAAVSQLRLIGGIVAGVGAAAIIAGIIVYPRDAQARVALVPLLNGAALAGRF